MSYRGVGGYYRAGDYGYGRGRRGDLGGGTFTLDSGGSDIVDTGGDMSTGGGGILGTGLSLPDISWGDLGGLVSGGVDIAKGYLGMGAPAGAPLPGGAPTAKLPATKATKHMGTKIARNLGLLGGHRRMNPLNPRAARRALRRLHGFDRIAKKILHVTSPKKRVHGFRFKKRRR